MRRSALVIVLLLAAFLAITFSLKNSQNVEINYYFDLIWNGPLSLLLVVVFTVGVVVGSVAVMRVNLILRGRLRKMEKEMQSQSASSPLVNGH